jgi:hypothetical protein
MNNVKEREELFQNGTPPLQDPSAQLLTTVNVQFPAFRLPSFAYATIHA